jgi:hypothetical protein
MRRDDAVLALSLLIWFGQKIKWLSDKRELYKGNSIKISS